MPPRAQPGEGIVVVVDVGYNTRLGLPIEETFFYKAKMCLINILQRKIFANKCRDQVGIVLFGTDTTENPLSKPGEYEHITVLQEPRLVDWGCVEAAHKLPRGSRSADWLDALVVAIDLLHDPKKELCSGTKIVLLTDFSGDFSDDQMDAIIAGVKAIGADLSIIGPEVADNSAADSNGDSSAPLSWSGKPKTTAQRAGEALAARLVQAVDGIMCSFEEAIPQLALFEKKSSGSANWNTLLTIGEDLKIPVTGRIKIKRATVDSWKQCHAIDENALIIKERSYHRTDDLETAVADDDVIDGYRYGTTLVPFTDEDHEMNYKSGAESAELTVLGFTRSEHCSLPERAGDQLLLVTARQGDEDAAMALSAVVQALAELDMVAVVRRVYRKGSNPVMGALSPYITQDYEGLVWVALPYQEDVRALTFPSLQRHMDALSADQTQAMDALIDSMKLCFTDADGDEEDLLQPEMVLNPQLQHYYNCLTDRALNLPRPLPQPHPHVIELLSVPKELREALDRVSDQLVQAFPTTKIVRRTKRERENIFGDVEENEGKRSKNDAEESLSEEESAGTAPSVAFGPFASKISTATPLQDFQTLLARQPASFAYWSEKLEEVLLQIVETLTPECIDSPVGRASVDKIAACVAEYRKESIAVAPVGFNVFMASLRCLCAARGVLREVWTPIAAAKSGLITSAETLKSLVTEEEAEKFLSLEDQPAPQPAPLSTPQLHQDYDDLLDDL